jgi:hypothetical protein
VAYPFSETGGPLELIRMQPKRRKGSFANLEPWSSKPLDERANALWEMVETVAEFGTLAMGLPVLAAAPDGGWTIAKDREFRVRDVLTPKAGRGSKGQKASVVRDGPKATEIARTGPGPIREWNPRSR